MKPAALLERAEQAGVSFCLGSAGKIKAKGRVQYKIVANRQFWYKGITACFNRELFSVQQLINFV